MLIDLHTHSSGISVCCKADVPTMVREAKKVGLDGIVLTNHYCKQYIGDTELQEYVGRYMAEYRYAAEYAEKEGLRCFFGIEVTLELHDRLHFLLYGVDENFLYSHPTMFDYTLAELYALAKKENAMLVQAHPHRKKKQLQDVSFMDGIEISCHPKYESTHLQELAQIAAKSGKILTCGGDYHADTPYRPCCGVYLPDELRDAKEIAAYLMDARSVRMMVQETDGSAPVSVTFARGIGLRE